MFGRLGEVLGMLADLIRRHFSSAQTTSLSRLVLAAYKALTAAAKLHIGAKGALWPT